VQDGDLIRLDSFTGTLEARVSHEIWNARRPAHVDLEANTHGMGRELFTLFRSHAVGAEAGGGVCVEDASL